MTQRQIKLVENYIRKVVRKTLNEETKIGDRVTVLPNFATTRFQRSSQGTFEIIVKKIRPKFKGQEIVTGEIMKGPKAGESITGAVVDNESKI